MSGNAWVHVHIGAVQGQITFASCYRCGATCRPDPWEHGQVDRVRLVEAFRSEHGACPKLKRRRAGFGRCRAGDPSQRDRICTGVAVNRRGLCVDHLKEVRGKNP